MPWRTQTQPSLYLLNINMADAVGLIDNEEKLVFETSGEVDVTPSFDNMGLKEELVRGIYAYGKLPSRIKCPTQARKGRVLQSATRQRLPAAVSRGRTRPVQAGSWG